jgi:Transposase DDE domain group 1
MQVVVNRTFHQSFGGINFLEADFTRLDFNSLITKHLGSRSVKAVYSYSDILKHLYYMFSIGGDVLDDLNILKEQLQDHPALHICSPDTFEYVSHQLKTATIENKTDKGVKHQINEHAGFNKLLPAISLLGGTLNKTDTYTLDYDGHIVENTKADNACNYKMTESYYPVICSINKLPVYMQNRNGNTPESYGQLAIIKSAIDECSSQGINITKFRADSCCYEVATIEYLESKQLQYYVRAEMNAGLRIALEDETEWHTGFLNNRKVEFCSIEEKILGSQTERRIVAYRYKTGGQMTIDQTNDYRYYAIVTNDQGDEQQCITFYNQRGCEGEHHFKELDYDFGWNKLPFQNLAMNTIYMYATTVAYLLFNCSKVKYAGETTFVKPQMRLKNFILHFVTLPAKWIKSARRYVLKIFTAKDYSRVFSP